MFRCLVEFEAVGTYCLDAFWLDQEPGVALNFWRVSCAPKRCTAWHRVLQSWLCPAASLGSSVLTRRAASTAALGI